MSSSRTVSFLIATATRQSLPQSLRKTPGVARPPLRLVAVRRPYSSSGIRPASRSAATQSDQASSLSKGSNRPGSFQIPRPKAASDSWSEKPKAPSYQLTFTCKVCEHRSSHNVSKQGYHKGSVLITCPSCHNRHVISDHLRIFSEKDAGATIEEILARKGQLVKKGTLGEDGDIEFWEDGTVMRRQDGEAAVGLNSESVPGAKTAADTGAAQAAKSDARQSHSAEMRKSKNTPPADRYAAHEKLKEQEQSSSTWA
jgi:mitochondrial protein import protein ZIM17